MPEAAEKFDTAMTAWQEWQDAPWGRLRYAIAEANLARHLGGDGGSLRILDLAGGDGGDAVRLAARRHHITIVDYAPAMFAAAAERASAAGLHAADHLRAGRAMLKTCGSGLGWHARGVPSRVID